MELNRDEWRAFRENIESKGLKSNITGYKLPSLFYGFRTVIKIVEFFFAVTGLGILGLRNAKDLKIKRLHMEFATLPETFDGYRILQLTDLHLDKLPGLEHEIARLVTGEKIDLVVLTGDYRENLKLSGDALQKPMIDLLKGMAPRDGILATLGNHDSFAFVPVLERAGAKVLINESEEIGRDGEKIIVTGLDDVNYFYSEAAKRALISEAKEFRICLVHSPEIAEEASKSGYSLYLAGHTHGGQICLVPGKPIFTSLDTAKEFARGLWSCRDMMGYTSNGAGVTGLAARFFCPPEIVLFTLNRKKTGMA